jgi:dephospho-CoA kinase
MIQTKTKIIGLTGGVGAGKSTVLSILEQECGAFVLQADQVGHLVMEPGGSCYEPVIRLFGKEIIKKDKTIDRRMVSDVVFSHADKREQLNAIIHPAVKRHILACLKEQKEAGRPICVVEAALLLEDHYQDFCDQIWYVHTAEEIRIRRLMESRGYTREKSEDIIRSQASEEFFRAHADVVIENNGDLAKTRQDILERVRTL